MLYEVAAFMHCGPCVGQPHFGLDAGDVRNRLELFCRFVYIHTHGLGGAPLGDEPVVLPASPSVVVDDVLDAGDDAEPLLLPEGTMVQVIASERIGYYRVLSGTRRGGLALVVTESCLRQG
jgi:hypothetical protein